MWHVFRKDEDTSIHNSGSLSPGTLHLAQATRRITSRRRNLTSTRFALGAVLTWSVVLHASHIGLSATARTLMSITPSLSSAPRPTLALQRPYFVCMH